MYHNGGKEISVDLGSRGFLSILQIPNGIGDSCRSRGQASFKFLAHSQNISYIVYYKCCGSIGGRLVRH